MNINRHGFTPRSQSFDGDLERGWLPNMYNKVRSGINDEINLAVLPIPRSAVKKRQEFERGYLLPISTPCHP